MRASTSSASAKKRKLRSAQRVYAVRQERVSHRTTVALSPESQEIVQRLKTATGTSASAAIDQIIRRSEPTASRLKKLNGFLVLDSPEDRPKVHATVEEVKRAEDAMDREYLERLMRYDRAAAPRNKKRNKRKSGR